MKYLEEDHLEVGKYYHCVTYNNEDIVCEFLGGLIDDPLFGTALTFRQIRYVLCEVDDLREKRKAFE